ARPIILLAGGYDKGIAFDDLGLAIGVRVAHLILLGQTGDAIATAVNGETVIHRAGDLEGAVTRATTLARAGDVVLLSPASASYDQFRNFEERGEQFRKLVENL
ncbi:MAG: UDP-N-acetylmuramoyl-L-alanine--D-glutamate ligase, partial [Candidatus Latescibacteria bacterium]|nr:UDP-N-acetylmuramoyl-L-alanine--D-glutamate ligase [Candidatus Latescibacterota bacterium]